MIVFKYGFEAWTLRKTGGFARCFPEKLPGETNLFVSPVD